MLNFYVTLLFYLSKKKVSLRAKRGNPVKKDLVISSLISFHCMRLPRFARNDILTLLLNY
jgi:hypothetical protein